MKKVIVLVLMILFGFNMYSQEIDLHLPKIEKPKIKVWAYVAGGSLIAIGGAADAYNQVQRHHLQAMLEKHPNLNLDFWGPNQWKNKWELDVNDQIIENPKDGFMQPAYIEKFWGSSRWLVFATDAHHATRTVDVTTTLTGMALINMAYPEKRAWVYFAEAGGAFIIRSVVFAFIHDGIYK